MICHARGSSTQGALQRFTSKVPQCMDTRGRSITTQTNMLARHVILLRGIADLHIRDTPTSSRRLAEKQNAPSASEKCRTPQPQWLTERLRKIQLRGSSHQFETLEGAVVMVMVVVAAVAVESVEILIRVQRLAVMRGISRQRPTVALRYGIMNSS